VTHFLSLQLFNSGILSAKTVFYLKGIPEKKGVSFYA
jgi:hypothetical protein